MKILENFWQSSETFGKLRKQFKSVFQCFYDFLKICGKSSEMFGNFRITSETVQKCLQRFYDFLKFSKIFGNCQNCSKIFGKFPYVIGNVRNGSQELKSFGTGF